MNAFFGNDWSFTGALFDPHVIYDPVADRFIIVCLNGSQSFTSIVVVGFATTSNPTDPWVYYKFNTSQFAGGLWFDYPGIGINDQYLCISGNLFNDNGQSAGAVILQMSKSDGYNGLSIGPYYWSNPVDEYGVPGASIFPLTYGHMGAYTSSSLFISTLPSYGSYFQFWILDNTSLSLYGYQIPSYYYEIGASAVQMGSGALLDVGDCRVKDGFYLYDANSGNGYIHFCFTSQFNGSGYHNGAIKTKITWLSSGTLSSDGIAFGNSIGDYVYPTISSISNSGGDGTVLMSAAYASSTYYPTHALFIGDDNNQFSNSIAPKFGENSVNEFDGTRYRWGDYAGVARNFSSTDPITFWCSGSYGKNDYSAGTWLTKINDPWSFIDKPSTSQKNIRLFPNPAKEIVHIQCMIPEATHYRITLQNSDGKMIHVLYNDKLYQGEKNLSFSVDCLVSGVYFLNVADNLNRVIASEKLIVQ